MDQTAALRSNLPNDPKFEGQWYLNANETAAPRIPQAWNLYLDYITTNDPEEVIVAVIDTGVDYNHPDLKNIMWTDGNGNHGYDYHNNDTDPMDDNGHGTLCAGIIAAQTNNSIGVASTSYGRKVKIMACKYVKDNLKPRGICF